MEKVGNNINVRCSTMLFWVLLLFPSLVFAQDDELHEKAGRVKEMVKRDINNENDKENLKEKLDEIKANAWCVKTALEQVTNYMEDLKSFETQVNGIDYDLLNDNFNYIREVFRKRKKEQLPLEEHRLRTQLMPLFYRFDNTANDRSREAMELNSPDFSLSMADVLKEISENNALKRFMEYRQKGVWLTDTLHLDSIQIIFTKKRMDDLQININGEINKELKRLNVTRIELIQKLYKLKALEDKITEKLKEDININSLAILLGLPLFCVTILILFLGPGYLQSRLKYTGLNNLLEKSQNVLLDLTTVLLLTMSILILGLSGNINNDVLGTLIGGIAGYVLNKVKPNQ